MLDVAPRSTTVNCLSVSYTYVPVSFSLASLFSFNLVISFFVFSLRSSSSILSQSLASSSRPNSSISASLYSWEFVSKDSLVFESRFLRCSSGPCATVTNNIQIKHRLNDCRRDPAGWPMRVASARVYGFIARPFLQRSRHRRVRQGWQC